MIKEKLKRINNYLLFNHPTIWNTRLVWMLLINFLVHFLFFVFGFTTLTDVSILQDEYGYKIFDNIGLEIVSIIVSVLILIFWLLYLFKNNAFKSFYPLSSKQLFVQFLHYLLIIFLTISFKISYNLGLQLYAKITFTDTRLHAEIQQANNGAAFLSHRVSDYTLNNRKYPFPFNTLHCETKNYSDNLTERWKDNYYQFYTLKPKVYHKDSIKRFRIIYDRKLNDSLVECFYEDQEVKVARNPFKDSISNDFIYHLAITNDRYFGNSQPKINKDQYFRRGPFNHRNTYSYGNNRKSSNVFYDYYKKDEFINYKTSVFYLKDSIVSVPYCGKDVFTNANINTEPSYFNYSANFYDSFKFKTQTNLNKAFIYNLLKRAEKDKIKQVLVDFLNLIDSYKIKTNINAKQWLNLVCTPNFKLSSIIIKEDDKQYLQRSLTSIQLDFAEKHLSPFFIESEKLTNVFRNLEKIRYRMSYSKDIFSLVSASFFLAIFLLIFRTTNLSTFIFTIISLAITLLLMYVALHSFKQLFKQYSLQIAVSIAYKLYILFCIGSVFIFLILPRILIKYKKKKNVVILLSLGLLMFPLLLFEAFFALSKIQDLACDGIAQCFVLENQLEPYIVVVIISLLTVFFVYHNIILLKKWKGLPES